MTGNPTGISADAERACLEQIARDSELFKSQYQVQPRQLSAQEILAIVKFLIDWDLRFSRYNPISAALLSAGRPQVSSQLGEIHTFLQSQIKTFQQMCSDQVHHVNDLNKMVQDANAAYNQSLQDGMQDSSNRTKQVLDGFRDLLES